MHSSSARAGLRIFLDINETLIRTGERTAEERQLETAELSEFTGLLESLVRVRQQVELVLITGNSFEYCRRVEEPLGLKNLDGLEVTIVSENGLIARSFRRGDLWKLAPPEPYFAQTERFLATIGESPTLAGEFYTQGNEIRATVKPVVDAFGDDQLAEMSQVAESVFETGVGRWYTHRYYFDIDPASVLQNGEAIAFPGKALAVHRLSGDGLASVAVGDSKSDLSMFEAVASVGGKTFWVANADDPDLFRQAVVLDAPFAAGVNSLLASELESAS